MNGQTESLDAASDDILADERNAHPRRWIKIMNVPSNANINLLDIDQTDVDQSDQDIFTNLASDQALEAAAAADIPPTLPPTLQSGCPFNTGW